MAEGGWFEFGRSARIYFWKEIVYFVWLMPFLFNEYSQIRNTPLFYFLTRRRYLQNFHKRWVFIIIHITYIYNLKTKLWYSVNSLKTLKSKTTVKLLKLKKNLSLCMRFYLFLFLFLSPGRWSSSGKEVQKRIKSASSMIQKVMQ